MHFNAVRERFSPYDTTFEISVAKDLKDSKLSAACSLHAASGSASSSTSSLRRRRLNEIAEEEEEEERERKRQSTVKEEDRRTSSIYSTTPSSPERPAVLDREQISSPQETTFASTTDVPEFTGIDRPTSSAQSEAAPRTSSQSTRPELYSYATYTYGKPKVKLGPRPSLDTNKRPSTAGNFRPIAALPAGFKFHKATKKGHPPGSEHAEKVEESIDTGHKTPFAIPEIPHDSDHQLPPRPATSSGASVKGAMNPSIASLSAKEAKVTPEKARLMKAMKLREKKKMMGSTPLAQDVASVTPPQRHEEDDNAESSDPIHTNHNDNQRSVSHADSGIAIDPPTPMIANIEDNISDSHPNSPTAATSSSEIGASTKASSLSESTDETVHVTKDALENDNDDEDEDEAIPANMGESEHNGESRSDSKDSDVSGVRNMKVGEESGKIPKPSHPPQSTEPAIRRSIEVDDPPENTPQVPRLGGEQIPSERDTPKSPWGLPVSKFSSNETKSSTSPKSQAIPSLKSKFSIPNLVIPSAPVLVLPDASLPSSIEDRDTTRGESSPKIGPEIRLPAQQTATRKGLVGTRSEFGKTTPRSEVSDPLLDDELMDELQSATVEEAKPMLVSKSPITPVFPNSGPLKPSPPLSRAVSNPMRSSFLAPSDVSESSARSVSAGGAAFLHNITKQTSNAGLQAKKSNIGSSISQRIKALEKFSTTPGAEDARPKTAAPSSTFFGIRRQSIRDPGGAPSVLERTGSMRNGPTPDQTRDGALETLSAGGRGRSRSVANRLSMFEMPSQSAIRGQAESIQVTARIVRDPKQSLPTKSDANTSQGDIDLKQSPLVVDVHRGEQSQPLEKIPSVEVSQDSIQDRRDKKTDGDEGEKKNRRTSLSIVKGFIKDRRTSIASKSTDNLALISPNGAKSPNRPPSAHQNAVAFARRLSVSSRRSSVSRERDNAGSLPSPAVLSDSGCSEDDKASEKKSTNRASRFMRRLSNSLASGARKNSSPSISPTVAEEEVDQVAAATVPEISLSTSSQPAIVAYMGDVNVQFPDNLLWKRRSMSLDTQGFLFLSAIQGRDKAVGAGMKRYHLSDFRLPYIPDVEIQELPNSVVLDLVEGSCLQIACEDRAGQLNMLQSK